MKIQDGEHSSAEDAERRRSCMRSIKGMGEAEETNS